MTGPIGKNSRNVTGNVSLKVYGSLLRLASQSGVGVSTYVSCLMFQASQNKTIIKNAKVVRAIASL